MPTITKITPQKHAGRFNLFLDDRFAFGISESTLVKFHLTKGMVLDELAIQDVKAAQQQAEANSTALNYLSSQQRTRHEVAEKLRSAELPAEVIQHTLDFLVDLHYLDDDQYAQSFINDALALGDKGPGVVSQKLIQRGLSDRVIHSALDAIDADHWLPAARRAAKKSANQSSREPFFKRQQKIRLALIKKGFSGDVADTMLSELDLQPDVDGEHERLVADAEKQWRLKRKYEGYDRRNRVKMALFRKGYDLDAIDAVLAEFND
ncbi:recombination regulator RecX [Lacticaseibacillus porcinae]|uniref:recombination regulator RecX n=1 Tax=Lacticaseibacillus porcinae TaxID=1123687 RepID=UPI000F7852BA|nr:recombination regulator RecX [Lacticaseibacillus porcinae]